MKFILSIIVIASFFCSPAQAEREVYAAIPVNPYKTSVRDTQFWVTISNPSNVNQTIELELKATGDFILQKQAELGNAKGSNMLTCASNICVLTCLDTCEPGVPTQEIAAGTNKFIGIAVKRTTDNRDIDAQSGVSMKIRVQGNEGFLVASGLTYNETYNGVAYVGATITVNGGRPF